MPLPELIEAAARSSNLDRAEDALHRLTETTRASGGELRKHDGSALDGW